MTKRKMTRTRTCTSRSFLPALRLGKRGVVDSSEIAQNFGYHIIAIIMLVALFFFVALVSRGIETTYYKSNYGVSAMNVEERFFNCVAYVEPTTGRKISKSVDVSTFDSLDSCMGIVEYVQPNGINATAYLANGSLLRSVQTLNYVNKPEITKEYPVVYVRTDEDGKVTKEIGRIELALWKV